MNQTRLESLLEACVQTAIGFCVTMALNPLVYPLFGHKFSFAQNLGITLIFTVVSIVRGYVLRRWFNARLRRATHRLAATLVRD